MLVIRKNTGLLHLWGVTIPIATGCPFAIMPGEPSSSQGDNVDFHQRVLGQTGGFDGGPGRRGA